MTSWTLYIEFMRSTDSTFESDIEILSEIVFIMAFEYVQILYAELLIFVPAESQSGSSSLCQSNRIQQIKDTFIVDL